MRFNWFAAVCLLLAVLFSIIAVMGLVDDYSAVCIVPALVSIGLIILAVFGKGKKN